MKIKRSLRLTIILFVFITMILSIFLGLALIIILALLGIETGYKGAHITFLLNILFISLMIGTGIAALLSKHVFKPLQDVIDGTKKVAKGNFNIRIPQKKSTDSEVSQLIESFNYMTEELSSIEMFRNDFINNFSHEFKTPISSIIGYAKELKRNDLSEQEKEDYLSIIISESERLSTLSSNILLLTKVENQKIISNKDTFALDEQIRNCILVLQKQWEQKNIDWDLDLDTIKYFGDQDLLDLVWTNLLNNAIKFSPNYSKISISLKMISNQIQVIIIDEGIGMDEKTLQHCFEKFYQGDTSHSTKGNGLGLPLVKKIIELLEGTISIDSKPNLGTSITIILQKK